jgi:hypothetical protein
MSRSLTYSELGVLLGITPASANKLARRKGWSRTKGNDGRTRVLGPEESLADKDRLSDTPPDSPGTRPGQTEVHALQARA